MPDTDKLLRRLDALLDRLELMFPADGQTRLEKPAPLMRWRKRGAGYYLEEIKHAKEIIFDDLQCIDRQKKIIRANTEQFINGFPANNVLLWGPRGTGKSSLIRALSFEYRQHNLFLLEVSRAHLPHLMDICDELGQFEGKFIIYCDDLSFEANDPGYKALKVLIDGAIGDAPENILIYATSNRRHLLPEYLSENTASKMINDEIHHSESIEEKLSLSERFGICLSFHPFNQEQYLQVVFYWLDKMQALNNDAEEVKKTALKWALEKGTRSGRSASQFARHWAGRKLLGSD